MRTDIASPWQTPLVLCLIRLGLLDAEAQQKLMELMQKNHEHKTLVTSLINTDMISSEKIIEICQNHFGMPFFDLTHYQPDEIGLKINTDLIEKYHFIPLPPQPHANTHTLHIGMSDPTDFNAVAAIRLQLNHPIEVYIVNETELSHCIHTFFRTQSLNKQVENALSTISITNNIPHFLKDLSIVNDEPIVQLTNRIMNEAILSQASDIHCEPFEESCRIRIRRHGILTEMMSMPAALGLRVITRIKILANLDIAERRLPQDGRMQFVEQKNTDTFDLRVNTCPTVHGEKLVLRLLNQKLTALPLNQLGLNSIQENILLSTLEKPQGLIIVTGPTGSGKTLTLYSALQHLNSIEKNIATVEDPIEIILPGINQVNVTNKIGLNFAAILRTLLRQDPDVIMIGEMRDEETAAIAIKAAQTGHLVLSTLHTNSALDAFTRLLNLNIAPYLLASNLSLLIAQRLVRKVCIYCHGNSKINCKHCHQGYEGRIGIFELVPITETLATMISNHTDKTNLTKILQHTEWMSLWKAGLEKVNTGITTMTELKRVLPEPTIVSTC